MSTDVLSLVWKRFPRGGSDLLAMLALADWSNDVGENIYPSVARLALKIRLDRRQTQRVLHRLIEQGWIEVTQNYWGGNPKMPRHYRIRLDRLVERGDTQDTGDTQDQEGCHPRHGRGVTGVTQYVSYPLVNRQKGGDKAPPPCPHQAIIDVYHEILPMCRRVRVWNEQRRRYLAARWREDPERQHLDWWCRFFEYIAASSFLTGRATPIGDRPSFVADLEWIVRPQNFAKIIEGKYEDRPPHAEGA